MDNQRTNPFSSDEYRMILGMRDETVKACMLLSFHEKVENMYHFSLVVDGEYYRKQHNLSWKANYTYRDIINRTDNNSQVRSDLLFDYHQQFEEMRSGRKVESSSRRGGKPVHSDRDNVFKQILSFFATIARAVCDSSDAC
jgi:hypothetical protein